MQAILRSIFGTSPDPYHPLSLFYHCDTAVLHQMTLLSQFMKSQMHNDLDRRSKLIKDLKDTQHNLMLVLMHIVDTMIPEFKSSRDFRVKYPDELPFDQFYGLIWFGAECLSAGSRIANHDYESIELKPYAVRLSRCIHRLREALRKEENNTAFKPTKLLRQILKDFDKSWVDFEFRYVSAMCSVQTEMQLVHQQEIAVLFSEATHRALDLEYFSYDQVELMDPAIMFAIPRLAIISGLVIFPEGPINPQRPSRCIPACFRPYKQLLAKLKDVLGTLSKDDLTKLEKALCANDSHSFFDSSPEVKVSSSCAVGRTDAITTEQQHLVCDTAAVAAKATSLNESTIENKTVGNENESEECREDLYELTTTLSRSLSSQDFLSRLTFESPLQHTLDTLNSGFSSSTDRLHKLFLAISEVADQLQSNFPRDYRAILKYVFQICTSCCDSDEDSSSSAGPMANQYSRHAMGKTGYDLEESVFTTLEFDISLSRRLYHTSHLSQDSKVVWVSDSASQVCQKCEERFSFFKRRHHCRSCGKVVCAGCSPYSLPLSQASHKGDRVCTTCYISKLGKMASSLSPTERLS